MKNEYPQIEPSEIENMQETMLQQFLDEINPTLETGINGISKKELREKYTELFREVGDNGEFSVFNKRLFETHERFQAWLESEKGVENNEVAKFGLGILKLITERSLPHEKNDGEDDGDNILQFK